MKKLLLHLLFLLSFSTSLYPLTNQDWKTIYALRIGTTFAGAASGGVVGYKTSSFLGKLNSSWAKEEGRREGERLHAPAPGIIETADQRQTRELPKKQVRKRIKRAAQREFEVSWVGPLALTTIGIKGGGKLGSRGGERLAIAYIARKYGVDRATALKAIEENLDLSERLKK